MEVATSQRARLLLEECRKLLKEIKSKLKALEALDEEELLRRLKKLSEEDRIRLASIIRRAPKTGYII